jgi:cation transport ATPase
MNSSRFVANIFSQRLMIYLLLNIVAIIVYKIYSYISSFHSLHGFSWPLFTIIYTIIGLLFMIFLVGRDLSISKFLMCTLMSYVIAIVSITLELMLRNFPESGIPYFSLSFFILTPVLTGAYLNGILFIIFCCYRAKPR